jgi:hypothetical protein
MHMYVQYIHVLYKTHGYGLTGVILCWYDFAPSSRLRKDILGPILGVRCLKPLAAVPDAVAIASPLF